MITTLALSAALAAPLSIQEANEHLILGADQPSLAKLDSRCKEPVDTILRAPIAEVVRIAKKLQVRCAKPRFPKLAARIDQRATACATESEACAAWLVHARAALIDVLGPDGLSRDFARIATTLAAKGVGDKIDAAATDMVIDAVTRASAAKEDGAPIQRLGLVTWFLIPAAGKTDAFAALIPRVLNTNPEDPEMWGAFTYLAEVGKFYDSAVPFLEAVAGNAKTAAQRGKASYLLGCLHTHFDHPDDARTAFSAATKADPFDNTYKKALTDSQAGVKFECKIIVKPFSNPLSEVLDAAQ